ncbi:MAG: class I SAM-dependent methyltransferase [Halobacteriaceae archaeon]
MYIEDGLDDILDTVIDVRPGYPPYQVFTQQLRDEIKALTTLVENERPKTILEIGTAKGGSLYIWSRYFDSTNQIISLDLPGGQFGGGYGQHKTKLFKEFSPSTRMDFVMANSHDSDTFKKVSNIVQSEIDFLFIDGDHTYEGVKQDFEMYSELVSEGGIIALHDIAHHPDTEEEVNRRREVIDDIEDRHLWWSDGHPDCNVDQYWNELVDKYDTKEYVSHQDQTWGGIGVVRK